MHTIWRKMRERCENPKQSNWRWYGGKGITVCDRWMMFSNFYADMGECPPGLTLDRIDTRKGYSPENCRWSDMKQQCRNRTNNVFIALGDKVQCIGAWAEETGLGPSTIRWRLKAGWPPEKILDTSIVKKA